MPAKSKKQQKLFGMVRAVQMGEIPKIKAPAKIKSIASSVSKKAVKDLASTKLAGLPVKVKTRRKVNPNPMRHFGDTFRMKKV
jgi:hypothetical protein